MSNIKEPLDLIIKKSRKHLTKEEIAIRKNSEIKVESKKVVIPAFLPAKFHKQFEKLATQLLEIGIFTNLDTDLLARYFISRENYVKFTARLRTELSRKKIDMNLVKDTQLMQDKAFRQVRDCANDLGLSITSRAKLAVPKLDDDDVEL